MVSELVHREQSRVYLERAVESLAEGDLLQASEKGWGAAAQMVKAVSEERGWEHWSHWRLTSAVSRLVEETGDDDLRTLFAVANHLHINFYEGEMSAAVVERAIQDVTRFIEKLEALLGLTLGGAQ